MRKPCLTAWRGEGLDAFQTTRRKTSGAAAGLNTEGCTCRCCPHPTPAVQPSPGLGEPQTQQGKGSVAWGLICSLTVVQHAADWGAQGPRRRDDEEAAGKLEMSALPLAAQLAPTKAREPTAQADWEAQTGEKPNQRGDATSEAGAAQGAQPTGGEHD